MTSNSLMSLISTRCLSLKKQAKALPLTDVSKSELMKLKNTLAAAANAVLAASSNNFCKKPPLIERGFFIEKIFYGNIYIILI